MSSIIYIDKLNTKMDDQEPKVLVKESNFFSAVNYDSTLESNETLQLFKFKEKPVTKVLDRLMTLEGQCRVHAYQFLKLNLLKAILLMIPIVLTVFGLFILKYYPCFRALVFYEKSDEEEATHLIIENNDHSEQIVQIDRKPQKKIEFIYKQLKYILLDGKPIPIGFKYEEEFQRIFGRKFKDNGLTQEQVQQHQEIFGKNQHSVKIPSFFTYVLDVLTTPFFLLQYLFCVAYFVQGYTPFSIALIAFSVITTAINYIMLWISFNRIKEMAQKQLKVNVLRDGKILEINSVDLVPGDVFQPRDEIPCDAMVLSGDIYVNEANLTGESYPIGKFPVTTIQSTEQNNTWLNEGSKVLETRGNSYAIVINTGFQTCRGRIIRKILTRERREPDLFRSAIVFVLEAVIVSIIVYCGSLKLLVSLDIETLFIFFKLFDFLGSAAPPPLPIYFNVAYSFALTRLRMKDISGTQPQQTVNGAYTKILCFDKTGTLTEIAVEIKKIFKIQTDQIQEVTDKVTSNSIIKKLFASCHTVKEINDEFLGDEIDKEMFFSSGYTMSKSQNPKVKFVVEKDEVTLQVLRINQFESKFQSMSVLVRDVKENKYYIFLKGAPEKIYKNAINKHPHYNQTVTRLSLSGFRTIGFGYRGILESQVEKYMIESRQVYEFNINALGLVGFDNKLKTDANETMNKLFESNIEPKMITGDNIFIGIETAVRSGIIKSNEPVILLEGKKQPENSQQNRTFKGILLKRDNNSISEEQIELKEKENYLTQDYPMAIDGEFLKMEPPPSLPSSIAIYARIKPEDKALIIKKLKAKIKQKWVETHSKFSRFLKIDKLKVGMCGDGANDLLALREADLSLGIQESDASYGSSFTIKKLLDSDEIIRESKNSQASIIQLLEYYTSAAFFNVLASIIMIADSTYYSSGTLMFLNFTSLLIFPVTFAFSKPAEEPTRYVPDSNFMGLHNHLIYWGNVIIPTGGICGAYYYFHSTSEFASNPNPSITIANGFNSQNYSATLIFLLVLVICAFNALFLYSSAPWKQRFYRNILFTILFLVNTSLSILFFFITKNLVTAFEMVEISIANAGICLGIMMGCVVLSFLYNQLIRSFKLDHKILNTEFDESYPIFPEESSK